jgi:urocanate hydratase
MHCATSRKSTTPCWRPEFAAELKEYGRIYMYRFRPSEAMHARPIGHYPAKCKQAAAIMLMIQNNLDPAVAQHPHELITYGGNGAVFQNWAQYLLTMQYLSRDDRGADAGDVQRPSVGPLPQQHRRAARGGDQRHGDTQLQQPDDWERMNALGVSQYGQMTAGSYMYIGPQGIVHGTTITVLNACRMMKGTDKTTKGKLFVTAGLGGMSGAQPKAGNIAGVVTICAEVNATAAHKRQSQGWVDEVIETWTTASMPPWLGRRKVPSAQHRIPGQRGGTVGAHGANARSMWTWAATRPVCTTRGPVATTLRV